MKIAITGATNSGKTTFASNFSKRNNIPLIEERFSEIRSLFMLGSYIEYIIGKFEEIFSDKSAKEKELGDKFVSDRCGIDLFVFWSTNPQLRSHPISAEFYKKWKAQTENYDYLVAMPWGTISYTDPEEWYAQRPNKKMNPFLNLIRHGTMIGLANMWIGPEKTIIIPDDIIDLDERTEWLTQRLGL
jgi:hypothetical protein